MLVLVCIVKVLSLYPTNDKKKQYRHFVNVNKINDLRRKILLICATFSVELVFGVFVAAFQFTIPCHINNKICDEDKKQQLINTTNIAIFLIHLEALLSILMQIMMSTSFGLQHFNVTTKFTVYTQITFAFIWFLCHRPDEEFSVSFYNSLGLPASKSFAIIKLGDGIKKRAME